MNRLNNINNTYMIFYAETCTMLQPQKQCRISIPLIFVHPGRSVPGTVLMPRKSSLKTPCAGRLSQDWHRGGMPPFACVAASHTAAVSCRIFDWPVLALRRGSMQTSQHWDLQSARFLSQGLKKYSTNQQCYICYILTCINYNLICHTQTCSMLWQK